MTTAFALLLDRCGLSNQEAASFLGLGLDAVKSLTTGRNRARDATMAALRDLYRRIENSATNALAVMDEQVERAPAGAGPEIVLAVANDDDEARSLGWPCVGAQEAMLGIVAARAKYRVRIVPRGSDAATAAAAQAHDQARRGAGDPT